ncbi:MAG: serine/threonine-protein phosphatase [Gammaproteobacteria bacterium]|nr:MAG: serine/threonine-protein phosphatase [Gammaproteobacteria bacterium]
MSGNATENSIRRGTLDGARMYVGKANVEADHFTTCLGEVAGATIADIEKPRPNEDSAAIIPVNDEYLVLIVADGVGGLAGARKASNLTVAIIRKAVERITETTGSRLRTAILDGIEAANRAVLDLGIGSASTLALAEIGSGYVRTYHVGDSILLICGQRGRIKMMTTPHSPIGFAMEAGLIDESEALRHDELNLIFNVIGSSDMRIEIGSELPMAPRDTLLLASDGLTDNVLQEEIVAAIRIGPLDVALEKLTDLAQGRMTGQQADMPCKPDDYSVILYRPNTAKRKTET